MSPYILFQGFVLLHQGEEFVLILPIVLLAGAFGLISWASKRDSDDSEADRDEQDVADEAEHDSPQNHELLSLSSV